MKIQELKFEPGSYTFDKDLNYRNIKVVGIKIHEDGAKEPTEENEVFSCNVTTWSKALRTAVSYLQTRIQTYNEKYGDFEKDFNYTLKDCIDKSGIKENSNFSKELFIDDSFIKSSVYKNNQNHKLKMFTTSEGIDKYICAVYIGEVIWVLNALSTVIFTPITILYTNRADIEDNDILTVAELKTTTEMPLETTREQLKQEIETKIKHILYDLTDVMKQLEQL